ncbi:TPA: hypothetical protein ACH3X3_002848 [Trebouxia sp. C0006]
MVLLHDKTSQTQTDADCLIVWGVLRVGSDPCSSSNRSPEAGSARTAEDLRQDACSGPGVLAPGDIDGLLAYIREDFGKRAYFITGDISDAIYDSNCYFADPTVRFSGLAKWKGNLKLLVPFLIEPKIQLTKLESQEQGAQQAPLLQAHWTLQTYLKLPWRPFIDVIGATEYSLNAEANQDMLNNHLDSSKCMMEAQIGDLGVDCAPY